MAQNTSKNRKSGSEEIFEQAENAGGFAAKDTDAQSSKKQAIENIREDSQSSREQRYKDENTDAGARRDHAQSQHYKGEAENVNDDSGRPLDEE